MCGVRYEAGSIALPRTAHRAPRTVGWAACVFLPAMTLVGHWGATSQRDVWWPLDYARGYLASLEPGQQVTHSLRPGRHAWLQVLRGTVQLKGGTLNAGDGAAVSEEPSLDVAASGRAEVMLFDLP